MNFLKGSNPIKCLKKWENVQKGEESAPKIKKKYTFKNEDNFELSFFLPKFRCLRYGFDFDDTCVEH